MPQAIGVYVITAVAGAAFATPIAASVLGTLILAGASAAISGYQKRSAEAKARRAYNDSLTDRSQNYRGSDTARSIYYGTTRANGLLAFAATHGANREKTTLVLAMAGEPFTSFVTFLANDAVVGLTDSGSDYQIGPGTVLSKQGTEYLTMSATSTGSGFVMDLGSVMDPGTNLERLETVVYNVPRETIVENGVVYENLTYLLRPTETLSGPAQYNLSGDTLTILEAQSAGYEVVATFRVSKQDQSVARLRYYLGNEVDTFLEDAELIAATADQPAKWTTAHRGYRVPRVHATFTWDETVYAQGLPNITAIVQGTKVYDPRQDGSNGGIGLHRFDYPETWTWSDNPCCIAAHYLHIGLGAEFDDIDWVALAESATICDEWVQCMPTLTMTAATKGTQCTVTFSTPHKLQHNDWLYFNSVVGMTQLVTTISTPLRVAAIIDDNRIMVDKDTTLAGTFVSGTCFRVQKRFTCNGVVSTEGDIKSNLEKILSSMLGICVYSGGKFIIRAAAYRVPTITLDDSDLADGTITVQARASRADLFNSVRGTFINPRNLYAVEEFTPYSSSTYIAEDNGEEIFDDIELPFTDDAIAAQRIAKLVLWRSRQALTIEATWKIYAYALQPGDTVRLSLSRYSWNSTFEGGTGKVFRVLEREFIDLSTVRLVLQEEASAIYSWTSGDATVDDPAPNLDLPRTRTMPVPYNINVNSSAATVYTRTDGVVVPYMSVTFEVEANSDIHVEVFFKRGGDRDFKMLRAEPGVLEVRFENPGASEVYSIYIQAVNTLTGARSIAIPVGPYTTSEDLPDVLTGGGPQSQNLLSSTSFTGGVLGTWGKPYGIGGTGDTTLNVQRHPLPAYYVSGSPGSVHLSIDDNYAGVGKGAVWPSELIPVNQGVRYVCYAGLIGWGTDGFVSLEWLDVNKVSLGSINSEQIALGVAVEDPVKRWNGPDNYTTSATIQTPPPGAAYARMLVVAGGTWLSGASKYLSIHKPFFGELKKGYTLPPWGPGIGEPVTTSQIAKNSTYEVYRQAGSDVQLSLPIGNTTDLISTFRLPLNASNLPIDLSGQDITVTCSFDLTVGPHTSLADAYAIAQVTWAASGIGEQSGLWRTLLRETLASGSSKTINCQIVEPFTIPESGVAPTWEFYLRAGCKSVVPSTISTPRWSVEILKV